MVGQWCYRSPWTGLVVGEYKVRCEENGQLCIIEENSRGGQLLSGPLLCSGDGWFVAELQEGNSCRLQLRSDDVMLSQFRMEGQSWEAEVTSRRPVDHDGTLSGWLQARGFSCPDGVSWVRLSVLIPCFSLAVSGAGYASLYGFEHGIGFAMLLLVHELGHAIMMRMLGIKCGPMVFLPFIGAAVEMKTMPAPAYEGLIALAGPVLGSAAAFCCMYAGLSCGDDALLRLARWGFVLNIINMLPIGCLDGGRVAAILGPEIKLLGLALCGLASVVQSPSLLHGLFFVSGCYATRPWAASSPLRLGAPQQVAFASVYLGLVMLLLVALPCCGSQRE